MLWVVIREDTVRGVTITGLFATAARASGYGFQTYGPINIGNIWRIAKATPPNWER